MSRSLNFWVELVDACNSIVGGVRFGVLAKKEEDRSNGY